MEVKKGQGSCPLDAAVETRSSAQYREQFERVLTVIEILEDWRASHSQWHYSTAAMRNIRCNGTIAGPRMECLLIASTTPELSHAILTVPLFHSSCHSRKACKMANISFQSIFFALCRDGILSEKMIRRWTHPMSFAPLASIARSNVVHEIWMIVMDDHDVRNWSHQRRS
jgi:hypothetical protein